jgi:hypothetical protein
MCCPALSAYSSGLVVHKDRPKNGPRFQYFVLLEQLEKRCISVRQFAMALGLTDSVLRGTKGNFPLEKLDQLIDLLNHWTGPTTNRQSGPLSRPVTRTQELRPVTREMLMPELTVS